MKSKSYNQQKCIGKKPEFVTKKTYEEKNGEKKEVKKKRKI